MTPTPRSPLHRLCGWGETTADQLQLPVPAPAAWPDLRANAVIEAGELRLQYSLIWQPSSWPLRLTGSQTAAAGAPRRRDGLWQHTCFEAFVAAANSNAYWEFNLATTGDWNVYRFDGYRSGQMEEAAYGQLPLSVVGPRAAPPAGDCRLTEPRALLELELRCQLPPGLVIHSQGQDALVVGLTAVLERQGGHLSYWALQHPGVEPDFHDRRGWLLRL